MGLKRVMRKIIKYRFQALNRVIIALALLTLVSCDKEVERLDDYLVEFATVIKLTDNYNFKLDNGTLLTPKSNVNYSGKQGDRVILAWTPSEDNIVEIKNISSIHTASILEDGYPNLYVNNPVKIQSVWVGGDYLNMILEIEYHSTPHSIAVLRDMQSETVDLHFAHSTNNDPRGYPQIMYASFLISSIRKDNDIETDFNLYINTNSGIRRFQLTLK